MQTLEQLLDFRFLTASFRDTPSLTDFFFTSRFFTNVRDVPTDEWEVLNFGAANTPVPSNTVGNPAQVYTPASATKRIGNMFYTYNALPAEAHVLQALREPDSLALQERGESEIERMQEEFMQVHRVWKEAILATALSFGRVNFDQNGNVLQPSVDSLSGALTNHASTASSADYTIPDNHRGALQLSTGTIIDNMWSTSSTRISKHLDNIRYQAGVAGVPRPTEIYINTLNKYKLRDNDEFQTWAKESNTAPDRLLRNEFIENLWGYNWHFVDGTYTDVNGNTIDLVPQTHAIITPPVGPWLRAVNGKELVPSTLDVQADTRAALNSLQPVFGEFSYAQLEHNPARLVMYMGDKFGIAFPNPQSIWMPNVFETDTVSGAGGTSGTG